MEKEEIKEALDEYLKDRIVIEAERSLVWDVIKTVLSIALGVMLGVVAGLKIAMLII